MSATLPYSGSLVKQTDGDDWVIPIMRIQTVISPRLS